MVPIAQAAAKMKELPSSQVDPSAISWIWRFNSRSSRMSRWLLVWMSSRMSANTRSCLANKGAIA